MPVAQASALQEGLRAKMDQLQSGLQGISETDASRRPAASEWSVKELLSHLSGENEDFVRWARQIVETGTPEIPVVPGQTNLPPQRQSMPATELLANVRRQYDELGDFVAGLSEDQLNRKAHVALLKDTPLGEYPTLAQWTQAIIDFHLTGHIAGLPAMRKQLGL